MEKSNLRRFEEWVELASSDEGAAAAVRVQMLKFIVNCPVGVLVASAKTLIECRREEIRKEIERN